MKKTVGLLHEEISALNGSQNVRAQEDDFPSSRALRAAMRAARKESLHVLENSKLETRFKSPLKRSNNLNQSSELSEDYQRSYKEEKSNSSLQFESTKCCTSFDKSLSASAQSLQPAALKELSSPVRKSAFRYGRPRGSPRTDNEQSPSIGLAATQLDPETPLGKPVLQSKEIGNPRSFASHSKSSTPLREDNAQEPLQPRRWKGKSSEQSRKVEEPRCSSESPILSERALRAQRRAAQRDESHEAQDARYLDNSERGHGLLGFLKLKKTSLQTNGCSSSRSSKRMRKTLYMEKHEKAVLDEQALNGCCTPDSVGTPESVQTPDFMDSSETEQALVQEPKERIYEMSQTLEVCDAGISDSTCSTKEPVLSARALRAQRRAAQRERVSSVYLNDNTPSIGITGAIGSDRVSHLQLSRSESSENPVDELSEITPGMDKLENGALEHGLKGCSTPDSVDTPASVETPEFMESSETERTLVHELEQRSTFHEEPPPVEACAGEILGSESSTKNQALSARALRAQRRAAQREGIFSVSPNAGLAKETEGNCCGLQTSHSRSSEDSLEQLGAITSNLDELEHVVFDEHTLNSCGTPDSVGTPESVQTPDFMDSSEPEQALLQEFEERSVIPEKSETLEVCGAETADSDSSTKEPVPVLSARALRAQRRASQRERVSSDCLKGNTPSIGTFGTTEGGSCVSWSSHNRSSKKALEKYSEISSDMKKLETAALDKHALHGCSTPDSVSTPDYIETPDFMESSKPEQALVHELEECIAPHEKSEPLDVCAGEVPDSESSTKEPELSSRALRAQRRAAQRERISSVCRQEVSERGKGLLGFLKLKKQSYQANSGQSALSARTVRAQQRAARIDAQYEAQDSRYREQHKLKNLDNDRHRRCGAVDSTRLQSIYSKPALGGTFQRLRKKGTRVVGMGLDDEGEDPGTPDSVQTPDLVTTPEIEEPEEVNPMSAVTEEQQHTIEESTRELAVKSKPQSPSRAWKRLRLCSKDIASNVVPQPELSERSVRAQRRAAERDRLLDEKLRLQAERQSGPQRQRLRLRKESISCAKAKTTRRFESVATAPRELKRHRAIFTRRKTVDSSMDDSIADRAQDGDGTDSDFQSLSSSSTDNESEEQEFDSDEEEQDSDDTIYHAIDTDSDEPTAIRAASRKIGSSSSSSAHLNASSRHGFDLFPEDLCTSILAHLRQSEIFRAAMVCRSLRQAASEPRLFLVLDARPVGRSVTSRGRATTLTQDSLVLALERFLQQKRFSAATKLCLGGLNLGDCAAHESPILDQAAKTCTKLGHLSLDKCLPPEIWSDLGRYLASQLDRSIRRWWKVRPFILEGYGRRYDLV